MDVLSILMRGRTSKRLNLIIMIEYIIYGQTNQETTEQVLCTKVEGEHITNRLEAEKIADVLTKKYGCVNVRIHEINLNDNVIKLFTNSINI